MAIQSLGLSEIIDALKEISNKIDMLVNYNPGLLSLIFVSKIIKSLLIIQSSKFVSIRSFVNVRDKVYFLLNKSHRLIFGYLFGKKKQVM